jgi:hypothetical protein
MTTGRHPIRGQVLVLALLVVLSLIMAVAAGACGGKGKSPNGTASTLHPSPSTVSGSPGTPPSKRPSTITPSSGASATGAPISDAAMRADILRRLSQVPSLVGIQFTVHVHNAVVRIYGTVKTQDQLTTAQQIALSEPGIKKVISYLDVKGQTGY